MGPIVDRVSNFRVYTIGDLLRGVTGQHVPWPEAFLPRGFNLHDESVIQGGLMSLIETTTLGCPSQRAPGKK